MFQEKAYLTQALGKAGMISRENPIPQSHPVFVEGDNVVAGRFAFMGSQSNQIKGTADAGSIPDGITIFERLQLNTTGGNTMQLNNGDTARKLVKGCAFIHNDGLEPNYGDHVLVDPLTGMIACSSQTSQKATAGKLIFANVASDYNSYTTINSATLSIEVDDMEKVLTDLDFSSVTSMADMATVINTALAGAATCSYSNDAGLVITGKTTGNKSTVNYISASLDLEALLGSATEIAGANAMVNTGWTVLSVNSPCQVIEVERL